MAGSSIASVSCQRIGPINARCERFTGTCTAGRECHADRVNERRFHLPSRPWRIAFYVVVLVVMLGVNYWGAHRVIQVTRIRVPYSPFFLQQVRGDNVVSITSSNAEIQGTFVHAAKPAGTSTSSTLFVTEIPSFADTNQLSRLLQQHGVVVNAKALDTGGGPLWERLLLGFGPTIVLLLLLVFI